MGKKNFFTGIVSVIFIVLLCISLFTPEQPRDYSHFDAFPDSERLELNDDVVVENINDLYYTCDYGVQGQVTQIYIHDKFSEGYGDGKFIFTYNGLRLNFDYKVEVAEIGSYHIYGQDDTATIFRVISQDEYITGSILVPVSTEDILTTNRVHNVFIIYTIAAVIVAFVGALTFSILECVINNKSRKSVKNVPDESDKSEDKVGALYAIFDEATSSYVYKSYDELPKTKRRFSLKKLFVTFLKFLRQNIKGIVISLILWYFIISGLLCTITTVFFGCVTGGAWFAVIPLLVFAFCEFIVYKLTAKSNK